MTSSIEHFQVRRIVTGVDAAGRSTIVEDADGTTRAITPTFGVVDLWAADGLPVTVDAGDGLSGGVQLSPPEAGLVVRVATFPPDSEWQGSAGYEEALAAVGGSDSHADDDGAGMHITDTIDILTLVTGQLHLVLETGETVLRPGDSVVQRGTKHAWSNRSDQPAVVAVTMISAKR